MPNITTHALAGLVYGIGSNIFKQGAQSILDPDHCFDIGEALAWGGVGGTVACVPDLLEPAFHPNHGSTCHSLAAVLAVLYLMKGRHSLAFTNDEREFTNLVGYSYLSHLALDSLTKKGLPII